MTSSGPSPTSFHSNWLDSMRSSPTDMESPVVAQEGFVAVRRYIPACDRCRDRNIVCCQSTNSGGPKKRCEACTIARRKCEKPENGQLGATVWCHPRLKLIGLESPRVVTPTVGPGSNRAPTQSKKTPLSSRLQNTSGPTPLGPPQTGRSLLDIVIGKSNENLTQNNSQTPTRDFEDDDSGAEIEILEQQYLDFFKKRKLSELDVSESVEEDGGFIRSKSQTNETEEQSETKTLENKENAPFARPVEGNEGNLDELDQSSLESTRTDGLIVGDCENSITQSLRVYDRGDKDISDEEDEEDEEDMTEHPPLNESELDQGTVKGVENPEELDEDFTLQGIEAEQSVLQENEDELEAEDEEHLSEDLTVNDSQTRGQKSKSIENAEDPDPIEDVDKERGKIAKRNKRKLVDQDDTVDESLRFCRSGSYRDENWLDRFDVVGEIPDDASEAWNSTLKFESFGEEAKKKVEEGFKKVRDLVGVELREISGLLKPGSANLESFLSKREKIKVIMDSFGESLIENIPWEQF